MAELVLPHSRVQISADTVYMIRTYVSTYGGLISAPIGIVYTDCSVSRRAIWDETKWRAWEDLQTNLVSSMSLIC
jgi:hypothetical protein